MGLGGSKPADSKNIKGGTDMTAIYKEYTPAFEECKKNPNFFGNYLLIQSITLLKFQDWPKI